MSWWVWRWRTWVRYRWAGVTERLDRAETCAHLAAGTCDECMADYFMWGHLP